MKYITNLDLNKNELQNAVLHPLASAPSNPKAGQIYYNSSDGKIYCYHNSAWIIVGDGDMKKSEYDNGGTKQVVFTGDSRLSDSRTPKAHKSTHATSGSDPLTPADIGAYAKPSTGIPKTDLASAVQTSLGKADNAYQKPSTGIPKTDLASGVQDSLELADSALQSENDPVFVASAAHGISASDITNWNGKLNASLKGAANGVAELGSDGKIPSGQLPSFVDDVLEYSSQSAFPSTGETGKIYVALDTNKTYRWSGSAYVEISESLALGETSSTAYRGDRGKTAYDHSQVTSGNPHGTTASDVGAVPTSRTVNGKALSSDIALTQDNVNDGTTYKQYSQTEKTKLAGIEAGATVTNLFVDGSETDTLSLTTMSDGNAGQYMKSNGSGVAPSWSDFPTILKKYSATNPTLTASGGAWTWSISASTHGVSGPGMLVSIYEVSSGSQVVADVVIDQSSYAVTITIVDTSSAGTLTSGAYRVVIVG